jgi:hypothetical protein
MLHVDLPTRAEIEKLASFRGSPVVSIYLRTTPVTPNGAVDRLELKALLKTAIGQMGEAEASRQDVDAIRDNVEALIDDDDFWAHQANSLAVLATTESTRTYRLPNHLSNTVEVSDRFHLKPLLRSVTFPHHAYVLAIGMGAVRLVEVSADLPPHVVNVPDLPRDARQALGRRSHVERAGTMRSGESTSENALLTRYARTVDRAIRPILAGHDRPLIIAAAEPMASIFRNVCSYPHLAGPVVAGSADHQPDHELAAAARAVLDQIYAAEMADLGSRFAASEGSGLATRDLGQAARAATMGAVDTLLIDIDAVVPGVVGEDDGVVMLAERPGPQSYGVIDEIARRALRSGARVVAARRADIPGQGDLAAILRYPI